MSFMDLLHLPEIMLEFLSGWFRIPSCSCRVNFFCHPAGPCGDHGRGRSGAGQLAEFGPKPASTLRAGSRPRPADA